MRKPTQGPGSLRRLAPQVRYHVSEDGLPVCGTVRPLILYILV